MDIIQYILVGIIIVLAIPLGVVLSRITREELKQGRRAFKAIIFISLISIAIILSLKLDVNNKIFLVGGILFILLLALTSLMMSYMEIKKKRK